jgi:hypothetical protein
VRKTGDRLLANSDVLLFGIDQHLRIQLIPFEYTLIWSRSAIS